MFILVRSKATHLQSGHAYICHTVWTTHQGQRSHTGTKAEPSKEGSQEWLWFSREVVRHSYSWKKDFVQTASSSCWFNASLRGLFLDRTACEQNKANRRRRERLEEGVKMGKSMEKCAKTK